MPTRWAGRQGRWRPEARDWPARRMPRLVGSAVRQLPRVAAECLIARHVRSWGRCRVWQPNAASLGTFRPMAHASRGGRMPGRSARLVAGQLPRVAAGCLVARHVWSLGQVPRLTAGCRVARHVPSSGQMCERWVAGQAHRLPAPPNPALQQTASRARSLLFERLLPARSRQLNANPLGGQAWKVASGHARLNIVADA